MIRMHADDGIATLFTNKTSFHSRLIVFINMAFNGSGKVITDADFFEIQHTVVIYPFPIIVRPSAFPLFGFLDSFVLQRFI